MEVFYESSFAKDLKRVRDVLEQVKAAQELGEISNLKKLQGYESYFRIRLGDYRIGIEVEKQTVIFVRILHRKDIYRRFP